jgi:hypothetical protein
MKQVLKLGIFATLLAASTFATTVYVLDSKGQLYTNSGTAALTAVGPTEGNIVTAIADYNSVIYGIDDTNNLLYTISPLTGVETGGVASNTTNVVALAADTAGNLWAASTTAIYEISTSGSLIKTYTGSFTGVGDLAFVGNTLYMTLGTALDTVTLSGTTATASPVTGGVTLPANTVGLAYTSWANNPGQNFYGFSTAGVSTVPLTGPATPTSTAYTGITDGGTITDAASDAVPEPATFGIIGLGLLGLGGLAYRRHKA